MDTGADNRFKYIGPSFLLLSTIVVSCTSNIYIYIYMTPYKYICNFHAAVQVVSTSQPFVRHERLIITL